MGALTSKKKAFQARNWELKEYQTVSLSDPFFSPIKIDVRDRKILRILPIIGTEEWINDNTRFFTAIPNPSPYILSFNTTKIYTFESLNLSLSQKLHEKTNPKEIAKTIAAWVKKNRNLQWIVDESTDAKALSTIKKMGTKIKKTIASSTLHTPWVNQPNVLNLKTGGLTLIKENSRANVLLENQLINHHRLSTEQLAPALLSIHEILHVVEGTSMITDDLTILSTTAIARLLPNFVHILLIGQTNQALAFPTNTKSQTRASASTFISLDPHISYNAKRIATSCSKFITNNAASHHKNAAISAVTNPLNGTSHVNLYGLSITTPNITSNPKIIKLLQHAIINETI